MKRPLLFGTPRESALIAVSTGLIASTYGLVRLAYGLFLPDIQASLSIGSGAAGYVSSAASVAYCVAALCGLFAAEHVRRLVLAALATAAVGCMGMALATDLRVLAASAVLGSSGAGLASPALVVVVARNVSRPRQSRAQATVNAGTGPGLVAAGALALLLLPHWRLGLAVSAVVTAATGVGVLLLDRSATDRPPRSAHRPLSAVDGVPPVPALGWVRALAVPAYAAALLGAGSAVVWTYGRAQLLAHGASDTASTLAWIALGAGGTLTILSAGALSRRPPATAWWITTVCVAGATATLGRYADQLALAIVACVVFGWGFVAATSALISWAAHLTPDHVAPGASLLFVTLVLGQAAGSALAGVVGARLGMPSAFALASGITLVASVSGRLRRFHQPGRPPRLVGRGP